MFELPAGSPAASVALLTSTNKDVIDQLICDKTIPEYKCDEDGITLLMMMIVCDRPDLISDAVIKSQLLEKDCDGKTAFDYCALLGRNNCFKKIVSSVPKNELVGLVQQQKQRLLEELDAQISSLFSSQVNEQGKHDV